MASENEKRETMADIVADMRREAPEVCEFGSWCIATYADRIEAAWRREKAEAEADALDVGGIVGAARTTEKSSAVGNAEAMREALDEVLEQIDKWQTKDLMPYWQYSQLFDICNAAFSAPPRNCDVGTAEEQAERCMAQFNEWRRKSEGKKLITAIMEWSQMPYEAKEGGAE